LRVAEAAMKTLIATKICPLHKANNVDFKPYCPGARRAVQQDERYSGE
jgi:hypothetical protein